MAKKYFTIELRDQRYWVFLSDVTRITKRLKKQHPPIPPFSHPAHHTPLRPSIEPTRKASLDPNHPAMLQHC